jgi:G:T-mismatch repair DNA endonuclease (very short patch repair protein)
MPKGIYDHYKIKGYNNPMKNPEIAKKVSKSSKGVPKSEEHKTRVSQTRKRLFAEGKLSMGRIGKTYKEIYKNDYSKVGFQKGSLNPMNNKKIRDKVSLAIRGRKANEETKRKMREKRALQIFPIKDTKIEIKIQNFLKELHIEFSTHNYISEITHAYQCDILINPQPNFMCEKKTIIEVDGDWWHGNPAKFPIPNQMQKEQIEEDACRNEELRDAGFDVIRLWGSDIKRMEIKDFKSILNLREVNNGKEKECMDKSCSGNCKKESWNEISIRSKSGKENL